MKEKTKTILEELVKKYPQLEVCATYIENAFSILKTSFKKGGRLYTCGNGGSSSDSEHIVGELLKNFKKHRPIDRAVYEKLQSFGDEGTYLCEKLEGALPAMSLISQTGILTAFANDKSWDTAVAQQLYGLGKSGDCLLVLSTSGNSKNCVYAVLLAKAKGIKTVAFTGEGGGRLKEISDICICVPEKETYKVQELHLPIYHTLCAMLEEEFF